MRRHYSLLAAVRSPSPRTTGRWMLGMVMLAACAPDRATAPLSRTGLPPAAAGDVSAAGSEQLLYNQPPLVGANLFTGRNPDPFVFDEVAAADFVVPPGGNWRVTRLVLIGVAYPTPPVHLFQVNVFRDNGSGEPGDILISGIGPVDENAPADPCCGGAVFDYDRAYSLDLPPGRYWVTNRIRSSTTRTFDPQLAVAVGHPGLIGEVLPNSLIPVPVAAPNNDFAFAVYGTIEGPSEAAADLTTTIENFGLESGLLTSLLAKMQAVTSAIAAGDTAGACASLQALINHASAQSGKKLTEAQATEIIEEATRIRAIIGC